MEKGEVVKFFRKNEAGEAETLNAEVTEVLEGGNADLSVTLNEGGDKLEVKGAVPVTEPEAGFEAPKEEEKQGE